MTTMTIREQLYRQIESLPDEIVEQIADFALFVMARRQITPTYRPSRKTTYSKSIVQRLKLNPVVT